jgi:hypothetical protein
VSLLYRTSPLLQPLLLLRLLRMRLKNKSPWIWVCGFDALVVLLAACRLLSRTYHAARFIPSISKWYSITVGHVAHRTKYDLLSYFSQRK